MKEKVNPELLNLLFARIAEDDEKAFKQFFDIYKTKVSGLVYFYTKSAEKALEVSQVYFTNMWTGRKTLNQIKYPRAYIRMGVMHTLYRFYRSEKREDKKNISFQSYYSEQQPYVLNESNIEVKQLITLIDEALTFIPEPKMRSFKMRHFESYSYEQIAAILQLRPRTVRAYHNEALKHLRNCLSSYRNK